MRKVSVAALAAVGSLAAAAPVFADNLLGLYAGAGIGESTVRSDNVYDAGCGYDGFCYDGSHHFAWKAMVGIRPIAIVGAELEYIDFGHPGSDGVDYFYSYGPDSHPRAIAAFGVGYLPLPLPFIDIYGKLGAARLHTNVNAFDGLGNAFSDSRWDTRFAYGVGVKSKVWNMSLHAEYERINSPYGDPDLFSVSATWNF